MFDLPRQLHGIDLGPVIDVGMDTHNPLDMRKFKRAHKLQLRRYNMAKAADRGWRLGLPFSLRVLHMEINEVATFVVSRSSGKC